LRGARKLVAFRQQDQKVPADRAQPVQQMLIIREKDPPRPSHRLTTLDQELRHTVAEQRGTDPARLTLLLRGDLDWIAMRCLEKDRTRRYETAASLAADVRRHLSHEPVIARPPSVTYRLQKFIYRHKLGFAFGAVTVLALIGALVLVSMMLAREQTARARERQLRQQADASAGQARMAAATSAQVAQFMKDMLSGVGPGVAWGRDTALLRDMLDQTARRLDAELRDQPVVAADLRQALGNVYRELGEYAVAELLLRSAVAGRRTLADTTPAQLAAVLDDYGVVLAQLNKAQEAEALLQEALALRRRLFGDSHPAVADTLSHLSFISNPARSMADVEAMRREVLRIRQQAFGPSHPAVADALVNLAVAANAQFDREKALSLQREAVAMRREHLDPAHPAIAEVLDGLGFTLDHLGERVEAAAAFREAFLIRRKMLGDRHPHVTVALLRFVGSESFANMSDDTVLLVREFSSSQRKSLPAGSPLLAPTLQLLAIILDRPGPNPEEARALAREARALFSASRTNGPPLDGAMVAAMDYFAWSKFVAGAPVDGLMMSEQAMELARARYRWNQRGAMQPARTLAWILLSLKRMPEAAAAFEEALRSIRAILGDDHIFAQMDVAGLGAAYRDAGRVAESRRVLEEALTRGERSTSARPYAASPGGTWAANC
jgi:tetratricopeptide (TPR) repeat protein